MTLFFPMLFPFSLSHFLHQPQAAPCLSRLLIFVFRSSVSSPIKQSWAWEILRKRNHQTLNWWDWTTCWSRKELQVQKKEVVHQQLHLQQQQPPQETPEERMQSNIRTTGRNWPRFEPFIIKSWKSMNRPATSLQPTSWTFSGNRVVPDPLLLKKLKGWFRSFTKSLTQFKFSSNKVPVKLSWSWDPGSSMPGMLSLWQSIPLVFPCVSLVSCLCYAWGEKMALLLTPKTRAPEDHLKRWHRKSCPWLSWQKVNWWFFSLSLFISIVSQFTWTMTTRLPMESQEEETQLQQTSDWDLKWILLFTPE